MLSNREIEVENLVKRYPGDVVAVDGISFKVEAGQIFGFLGPNGAGKSTTIKILTTLGLPTGGKARVGGFDVVSQAAQVRRVAGVALQEIGLDPMMKPVEMLALQGQLFGENGSKARRRSDELIQLVGLEEAVDRRVGTFSGGMRRRLDLALALVHKPEILFLDEPTTGLDPASRRGIWDEVRRLNRYLGMTIFLTTQYLEEADELAEEIAIIDQGRLAVQGSPARLKSSLGSEAINLVFEGPSLAGQASDLLANLTQRIQADREVIRLYLPNAAEKVPAVVERLNAHQLQPVSLTLTQPTLDDVFLQVTGQRLAAPDAVPSLAA